MKIYFDKSIWLLLERTEFKNENILRNKGLEFWLYHIAAVFIQTQNSKVVNYYCRTDEELKYSDYGVSDYLIEKKTI